jgi:transposase-like protein
MPINVTCESCGQGYSLRDDFAGKKVRCKNCQSVLEIPFVDQHPTERRSYEGLSPAFDRDKFLVNQKRLSINERYYVNDDQNRPILLVDRPTHLLRSCGAILAAVLTFIVLSVMAGALGAAGESLGLPTAASGAAVVVGMCLAIFATLVVTVLLSPKRHITFYTYDDAESRSETLLEVFQDKKFAPITATYTVKTPDGQHLGLLSKNYLYNLFRKQWRILGPNGELIALAKEDSLILSLLRRLLGPLFGLLRANFILVLPDSDQVIGEFNRKFTLFDRYVLDMTSDREHRLDRRIALAIGVLLDTGERR